MGIIMTTVTNRMASSTSSPQSVKAPLLAGPLITEGELTLQTRRAQYYFKGGGKRVVGVPRFARYMLSIWHAAAIGDPYADLLLLRVYEALTSTRQLLKAWQATYEARLMPEAGVNFKLVSTQAPVKFGLHFGTIYGNQAAYLLADFDRLARCLLTLKRVGLESGKSCDQVLRKAGDRIRKVLTLPRIWQETQVTRDEVRKNTARAQTAARVFKSLGILPSGVLEGILRAPVPYAPVIKNHTSPKT